MSTVQITPTDNSNAVCEIDPMGASIARLRLANSEIIWSGTRPDGGRGVTHPCIPNFNIADGLPNHGPARKAGWLKVSDNSFSWEMEEIPGIYPAGLHAVRTFELSENQLHVSTTISNTSDQALAINIAEHNYFVCTPVNRKDVKVNGKRFDQKALDAEAKYTRLDGNVLHIEIPHLPIITLKVSGYGAFAQWSQPDAPFVCIEPIQVMPLDPAKFLSDAPKIEAGEEKVFEYWVSVG